MSSADGDGFGVFQSGDNHSLKELPTERQVVPAASLAQTQLVSGPIPLWNLKRPSMMETRGRDSPPPCCLSTGQAEFYRYCG